MSEKVSLIIFKDNNNFNWINKIINLQIIEKIIIYVDIEDTLTSWNSKIKIVKYFNIKRNLECYLDYIIKNYNSLPDNLIFANSFPFKLNDVYLQYFENDNLTKILSHDIHSMSKRYDYHHPPFKNINQIGKIDKKSVLFYTDINTFQVVFPFDFVDDSLVDFKNMILEKYHTDNIFNKICKNLNLEPPKKLIPTIISSCFFIKSKSIKKNNILVYQKLKKFLNNLNNINGDNYLEYRIIDKLWYYLFTYKSYDSFQDIFEEKFKNINPEVKIYNEKNLTCALKKITDIKNIKLDPFSYFIYYQNQNLKVLPGIKLNEPDIQKRICFNFYSALNINFQIEPKLINTHTNPTKFYFYLRGHIRESFNNPRLKNLIQNLQLKFPNIVIILQTWKNIECKPKNSWRDNILEKNITIQKSDIEQYFEDTSHIKHITILDENEVKIIGKQTGLISNSRAPVKGWKYMWYGILKGLEHLNLEEDLTLVSFRYDYFNLTQCNYAEDMIIEFMDRNLNTKEIVTIDSINEGIDNIYLGPVDKLLRLINIFHTNLDEINEKNPNFINQEMLFFIVMNTINNN